MSKHIDLSIIIPAYQEAEVIESTLDTLADYLKNHNMGTVEVVVVVADSPDGTSALARSKAKHFTSLRVIEAGTRVGKGRDVRIGIYEATGRYKLFMDADLATPIHHLDDAARVMAGGASVGIAVRDLLIIHDSLSRKFMSKGANLAAQILAVPGIKDTQCGFKLFETEAAEAIFSRQTMLKWSFDMEILAIARQLGYKIETFDAPDWHDPKEVGLVGDSQLQIVLKGFMDPFRIRLNIWQGRYRKPSFFYKSQ
jgi:dolichyl-phosphate beta-glucosyltransferase